MIRMKLTHNPANEITTLNAHQYVNDFITCGESVKDTSGVVVTHTWIITIVIFIHKSVLMLVIF
jgi:hypothetical protein